MGDAASGKPGECWSRGELRARDWIGPGRVCLCPSLVRITRAPRVLYRVTKYSSQQRITSCNSRLETQQAPVVRDPPVPTVHLYPLPSFPPPCPTPSSKAHRDAAARSGKAPGSLATDSALSHALATGPTTPVKPIPGSAGAPEPTSPVGPRPLPGSRAHGSTGSPTHGSRDDDSDPDGSGPDEYDPESPDPDGNGSGSGWVVPTRGSHGSSGSGHLRERQPLLARALAGGGERGTPGSASSAGSSMRSGREGDARRGGGGAKQVVYGGEHTHMHHHLGHGQAGHGIGQGEGGCRGGGGVEEEGEGDLKTRDVVRAAMLVGGLAGWDGLRREWEAGVVRLHGWWAPSARQARWGWGYQGSKAYRRARGWELRARDPDGDREGVCISAGCSALITPALSC